MQYTFKELKQKLKKDTSSLPVLKVALLGDTATQFLATGLCGMAIERGYRQTGMIKRIPSPA
jgi:hypothetical protein